MFRKKKFQYPELEGLSENKLLLKEKFELTLGILIVIVMVTMVIIPIKESEGRAAFSCFTAFIFLFIAGPVFYQYRGRNKGIEVFKQILDKSDNNLKIKSIKKEPGKRIMYIESLSNDFPYYFKLAYNTGTYGMFSVPIQIAVDTDFEHPFTISLVKSRSKEFYNFENKNLEKIADKFKILNFFDYIFNWKDELIARLYGEPLIKDPIDGAEHVIDVLKLMQLIMKTSTSEKPQLRVLKKGENFKPISHRLIPELNLASVCLKCKKPVRFWKKREKEEILQCPNCRSDTVTIIAPYIEKDTTLKIIYMKKLLETNDKEKQSINNNGLLR